MHYTKDIIIKCDEKGALFTKLTPFIMSLLAAMGSTNQQPSPSCKQKQKQMNVGMRTGIIALYSINFILVIIMLF